MAQVRQAGRPMFWLRPALIFGVGGAIFVFLTLWLVQGVIQMFGDGRLIQGAHGLQALGIAVAIIGVIGVFVLKLLFGLRIGQAAQVIGLWLLLYLLLWLVGAALSGMSLPVYLICWVVFGLAGGILLW